MRWEKIPIDPGEVRELSRRYKTDLLVSSILWRRHLSSGAAIQFFLEDDLSLLHNPFHFAEMSDAVDRIRLAIDREEKILVFGDRDVDGITATTLMVEALRERGADVSWQLPMGDTEYGLTRDVVEQASSGGAKLIITVDCGVSSRSEVEAARQLGIDTIIVDHHYAGEELPNASALVNPKVEDSGYPYRDISACAVAFKLDWALRFSYTTYYGKPICLLNVRPAHEAWVLESVKMENLLEVDRLVENLVPGLLPFERSQTAAFLKGHEVVAYDGETQKKQLVKLFGEDPGIPIHDIVAHVGELFPEYAGRSLLKIRESTRTASFLRPSVEEIDVLSSLFTSVVLKREGFFDGSFVKRLDLVALATLSDIMPLLDENRILLKRGLESINDTTRMPLRELLVRTDLSEKRISSKDLSWSISPLLNASGRMGVPDKAVHLLLSQDRREVDELASNLMELNGRRKDLESAAWNRIQSKARSSYEETGRKLAWVVDDTVKRGITGILASRLSRQLHAPAAVIALLRDRAVGSLRSPKGVNIRHFLGQFEDILTDFGGHDYAAGFNLPLEEVASFEERLRVAAEQIPEPGSEEEVVRVDAEIPSSYLTPELWKVVELFEPYGEENPPLVFLTKGVKVLSCEIFGKQEPLHVKLLLDSGRLKWPAIFWRGSSRVDKDFSPNDSVDVLYRVERNYWQGQDNLRLILIDIAR
jgi:single-stranded-DNA-specific exonuclease